MDKNGLAGHAFFMSIFYLYLSKLFNKEQIVIGTPVLNRPTKEFKSTVGLFINFIPNIIDLKNILNFNDLVNAVNRETKSETISETKSSLTFGK